MESDAFSTALLVLGSAGHKQVARCRSDMCTLLAVAPENGDGLRLETNGIAVC
jgi:hypothetical protein